MRCLQYQQVVAASRDGSVLARITIVSSRAPGRAGTKTCRLLRIIAYMFLPLKRGVIRRFGLAVLKRRRISYLVG